MSPAARHPGLIRAMVLAVTVVFTALAVVIGQGSVAAVPTPVQGQPSPQTYVADDRVTVEDRAATEARREAAVLNVETVFREDAQTRNAVILGVRQFFQSVRAGAAPILPPVVPDPGGIGPTTVPEDTTPTTVPDDTTGTTTEDTAPPEETTTTSSSTTTTTVVRLEIENQIVALGDEYPLLRPDTIDIMVKVLNDDFVRDAAGEPTFFLQVEEETLRFTNQILEREGGILTSDLQQVKEDLVSSPPFVIIPGLPEDDRAQVQIGIADVVANFLQATRFRDDAATAAAREEAAASVAPVTIDYVVGENIVSEGEIVTAVHLEAINTLDLLAPAEAPRLEAMAAVAALTVVLAALFLWRVAPEEWRRPKSVTLFGLLIVAAAVASRLPEIAPEGRVELGYVIPAALFGFVASILFDSRASVLMAVPLGTFTALATGDIALTVFAAGATLAPVPFVSSVASRTELRFAVFNTAVVLGPFATAVAGFFTGWDVAWKAGVVGFANGIASGVAALGVLPFLENLFRVTTTLTLLDLTDRNHPALRLIEEEAPGTFNHSIMVGTLAGKAARAIGANTLLAQAAAYYHDLGKTVQPQFFIENQFGVSNPHDDMRPEESAKLLRSHVSEGLKLARRFGIPADVAQGIRQHHGTGLMRYFYHKALDQDPDIDPSLYRHTGEKPRAKEMAILMLSDAVEGATRALVQHEDPTSGGIRKVVEQVVGEKVDDGQLDESALTFGELTRVKDALVDALTAYYHTRIPYPGFPGSSPDDERE